MIIIYERCYFFIDVLSMLIQIIYINFKMLCITSASVCLIILILFRLFAFIEDFSTVQQVSSILKEIFFRHNCLPFCTLFVRSLLFLVASNVLWSCPFSSYPRHSTPVSFFEFGYFSPSSNVKPISIAFLPLLQQCVGHS